MGIIITIKSAIDVGVFCFPPMEQPPPPPEGVGDGGGEDVVTVTVFEKPESPAEELNAAMRYKYVVEALSPVSVNVVTFTPTVPISTKLPPGDCLCILTPCDVCELFVHARVTEVSVTVEAISPVGGLKGVTAVVSLEYEESASPRGDPAGFGKEEVNALTL